MGVSVKMKKKKKIDKIYCPECRNATATEAVICPNCRVQVRELKVSAKTLSADTKPFYTGEALLLEEGKRQLGGAALFYWFVVIFTHLIILLSMFLIPLKLPGETPTVGSIAQFIFLPVFVFGIFYFIYIIFLVAIIKRKFSCSFYHSYSCRNHVFLLAQKLEQIFIKRINHPLAKGYLVA